MANLPTLPTRTALIDAKTGKMAKPWIDALQQGLAAAAGRSTVTVTADSAGNVTIDEGLYENLRLALPRSSVTILAPINSTGTVEAGDTFSLYLDQDQFGGCPIPAFRGGTGGFASDTQAAINATADGGPSTRTRLSFKFDGNIWFLDHIPFSGGATS